MGILRWFGAEFRSTTQRHARNRSLRGDFFCKIIPHHLHIFDARTRTSRATRSRRTDRAAERIPPDALQSTLGQPGTW